MSSSGGAGSLAGSVAMACVGAQHRAALPRQAARTDPVIPCPSHPARARPSPVPHRPQPPCPGGAGGPGCPCAGCPPRWWHRTAAAPARSPALPPAAATPAGCCHRRAPRRSGRRWKRCSGSRQLLCTERGREKKCVTCHRCNV